MKRPAFLFTALLCLAACGAKTEPVFHANDNPQHLSDWGQMAVHKGALRLSADVTPYDLNTPLFSDYAQKLRTVWIEGNQAAAYSKTDTFDFPVGTVITKTFYYAAGPATDTVTPFKVMPMDNRVLLMQNMRLMETRVLARREDGWVGLPYVWNQEQTEAILSRTGDAQKLTMVNGDIATDFTYIVPNVNQCAGCHGVDSTSKDIQPIGPKARHVNKEYLYPEGHQNQLKYWQAKRLLQNVTGTPQANANWADEGYSVDDRARAYLDINCSHCHSNTGPADTSGLHLTPETPLGSHFGVCKTPIAAGRGTGNRQYGIVPGNAEASIFTYRIESTNPAIMMPELGRSLTHSEGATLIREWINGLDGTCEANPSP